MDFGGLDIASDDDVLEPRPWTIEQSRWAVEVLRGLAAGPVLELCCGAGQIGLLVAAETGRPLVQVDADERACGYARRNAEVAGVDAEVRCRPVADAVADDERFVLVLADPPYVPTDDVDDLPDDPERAIDGGEDGLDLARACLQVAARHLVPGGLVLLQLGGPRQAATMATEDHGLVPMATRTIATDRALLLLRG